MSKTDKTAPFWVQAKRNCKVVYHDHRRGYCDLDQFDERHPGRTWCGPKLDWTNYSKFTKAFSNPIKKDVENRIERSFRRRSKNAIENKDPDNVSLKRRDSKWDIC